MCKCTEAVHCVALCPLKAFRMKPPWSLLQAPFSVGFKPPSALASSPWSPLEAPLKHPSSPFKPPLPKVKPPWSFPKVKPPSSLREGHLQRVLREGEAPFVTEGFFLKVPGTFLTFLLQCSPFACDDGSSLLRLFAVSAFFEVVVLSGFLACDIHGDLIPDCAAPLLPHRQTRWPPLW